MRTFPVSLMCYDPSDFPCLSYPLKPVWLKFKFTTFTLWDNYTMYIIFSMVSVNDYFTLPRPVIGFIQKKENDSMLQMVKIHFFLLFSCVWSRSKRTCTKTFHFQNICNYVSKQIHWTYVSKGVLFTCSSFRGVFNNSLKYRTIAIHNYLFLALADSSETHCTYAVFFYKGSNLESSGPHSQRL